MVTEIVDLDLGSNSSFKIITMQGDIASRFIEFHLTYNNETFDLTGKTVSCRYLKDDKTTTTTNLVINDKTNGICTLDVPYTLMKNPYVTRSELIIKQSSEILSTIPFTVEVVKSLVKSSVVESSDEFGALNEALWRVEGFKSEMENINSRLEEKASVSYVDTKIGNMGNTKTFKGSCIYSELPASATVDDYWYVSDRNSNYCWNGSQWIDIGNDLEVGSNSIGLTNLEIDIQEDVGEYKEVDGLLTKNEAYYPSSNVATAFESLKWSNIIIDNVIDGTVFKITLSYINPDAMYGIIFTDDKMKVISTDLKGTNTQQNVKDYRVITPKGATKIILNCFEPSKNEFKVTALNYEKIATRKYVEENSISNVELGKSYYIEDNKIDSSKYENKSFVEVFPNDDSFIELPISDYANLGDGIGYRFNIWFTDGTNITGTSKVKYLNKTGQEITWYAYGNAVVSAYPITGAAKIRAYSISRTKYPDLENKTIKGFTLSNIILSDYIKYKLNTTYKKIEEIAILKAQQVAEEKLEDVNDKISMLPSTNYDNVIRSINRIGYDVYNSNTPPEQSIESFKLAYKKGFRILLCDLRFTKDNIPVCIHDATINSVARNSDGTVLSETITVAEKTLEELNSYDFGLKKGEKYRGTKILTLDGMCKLVKKLGVELYIEVKDTLQNEDEKIKAAVSIVRKHKLNNVSWAHDNVTKFGNFTKIAPEYRVATMPGEMNATRINELLSLKTPQNSLFWFSWDTSSLPVEIVNLMQQNNIEFEVGTIDSESALFKWFNTNELRQYCTGVSSNKIVAGKVILEKELN